ncbi:endonuclease III [Chlorobaculum parvum NCIB 8327]|uniref:Endonuclease III n=1 Tax=Chlorobaculum parvum (strain DSM 263 / NCIMB 8327) TaxID=517417 RepID=B3QLL4_CHLP8|nr:endonuclease III [Chlorobaculum parvum]ACF10904.1 endonuclease III [Chlorobaculum parvum NCIB 8327]
MSMTVPEKIAFIDKALTAVWPNPKSELDYETPFQLLVATIMAAQATDKKVNQLTVELFKAAPDAEAMSRMDVDDIKTIIRPINYYNNKAKNILAMSQRLVDEFGGDVPASREALESLPGVGRKTANVVLSNAFGVPTMPVDTHVHRVSNRIGLCKTSKPEQTEEALLKIIPESRMIDFHHYLVLHGRYTCKAKKPECSKCPIIEACDWPEKVLS